MWSKLIGTQNRTETSVQIVAKDYYDMNYCGYHNWGHILDCYDYLEENQIVYDEDLDWAVMHHDIVYDHKPEKEKRSAELMLNWYPNRVRAAEIIMSTVDHKISTDTPWQEQEMIKADLHQLGDLVQSTRNYTKIMDESLHLYKITPLEFAKANSTFMMNLQSTVFNNYDVEGDTVYWDAVAKGVEHTISISQSLIKNLDSKY